MRKIPDILYGATFGGNAWQKIRRTIDFGYIAILVWNIVFLTVTLVWGFFIWFFCCAGYSSVWPKLAWTVGSYVAVAIIYAVRVLVPLGSPVIIRRY